MGKREGEIIREIGTFNKNMAGRTCKEYRIDNAKRMSEYGKERDQDYKDKLKAAHAENTIH